MVGFCLADFIHNVHAFDDFPEDRVLAVEEVVVDEINEELRTAVLGPAFAIERVPRPFWLLAVNSSFIA